MMPLETLRGLIQYCTVDDSHLLNKTVPEWQYTIQHTLQQWFPALSLQHILYHTDRTKHSVPTEKKGKVIGFYTSFSHGVRFSISNYTNQSVIELWSLIYNCPLLHVVWPHPSSIMWSDQDTLYIIIPHNVGGDKPHTAGIFIDVSSVKSIRINFIRITLDLAHALTCESGIAMVNNDAVCVGDHLLLWNGTDIPLCIPDNAHLTWQENTLYVNNVSFLSVK